MTVHFIGAGPGAKDLITIRGLHLIRSCRVCLYAGSLVPREMIADVPKEAKVLNTADMTLNAIIEEMRKAHETGKDVARLHSGDPSLYGAIAEQIQRLDQLHIPYDITPGVPTFSAAAAALKQELTIPGLNQSLILSRTSVHSSPMPKSESLVNLAASRATIVLHLSAGNIAYIQSQLIPLYGKDCPVVVVARVGWPDECILRGILSSIDRDMAQIGIKRTAIIFIGKAMASPSFPIRKSSLYAENCCRKIVL
ncbi:MAG: precorrin-4/cobalt-precorrin-4 C11-methyltransferase [Candidatus Tokpelaia sp. JSC188]|nr:MAG: precorrin-4/cobalt-precorrin-4 C11-methyltransferase [Candidatus Tokpelaia sp. JSC188]